jgi:capsular exopolysaccharide synthesis family protein
MWQEQKLALARLQLRERDLLANLKEDHPQVQEVRKQIQNYKDQLAVAAQLELARMQDRHKALTLQLEALEAAEYKWQAKNMFASQRMGEFRRLQDVVRRYEHNYEVLYDRLHSIRVSEELKVEHFNVLNKPSSSARPVWPNPMRVLLVALIAGLGSGFGLALVVHLTDNKIQSVRDVEKEMKLPFLGGVPFWVHSGLESSIRPIVTEEHSTGAVEAYRALRTTLVNALSKINERIVFFTSADSKEGKTLTALNVAIMIAQMGKKVLLVDMDLRRGRLHRSLGLDKEPGVSDVLKEGLPLRSVIQRTKVDNLYVAPSGSAIDDSAELLQSSDLMNMLVELQNEYDYICIDTSPVLRVTDTVIMTTQRVGVVVYVARVNHTPKPLIRYSLEMLKDAKILGLIMNSIEMHRISSLYYTYQYPNYAYYSNAYAYGYNYYYYGDGTEDESGHRRRVAKNRGRPSIFKRLRRTLLPMN